MKECPEGLKGLGQVQSWDPLQEVNNNNTFDLFIALTNNLSLKSVFIPYHSPATIYNIYFTGSGAVFIIS